MSLSLNMIVISLKCTITYICLPRPGVSKLLKCISKEMKYAYTNYAFVDFLLSNRVFSSGEEISKSLNIFHRSQKLYLSCVFLAYSFITIGIIMKLQWYILIII